VSLEEIVSRKMLCRRQNYFAIVVVLLGRNLTIESNWDLRRNESGLADFVRKRR